jgi:hypothetical protein
MSGEGDDPEALIAAWLEGRLDDADQARLAAWATTDANRELLAEQARLHRLLATSLRRDAGTEVVRRARLIPGSFSPERTRLTIASATAIPRSRAAAERRWWRRPGTLVGVAAALLAAVIAPLALVPSRGGARSAVAATVVRSVGETRLERHAQVRDPAPGATLRAQDALVTGTQAELELGFAGEATRITLSADSRLVALDGPGKRFRLEQGFMRVTAAPQPAGQPLVVATPRAEITVVGTAFSLSSNPLMSWLEVQHGTVRIARAAEAPLEVAAGQRACVTDVLRVIPQDRGCGLLGAYFSGADFRHLALMRVDPAIDFDWKGEAPGPGVEAARFSVRWTGEIEAPSADTYRFFVPSDDGVRLWIDGRLVYEDWHIQSIDYRGLRSGSFTFAPGRLRVPIRIDYFEYQTLAAVQLSWQGPGQPRQVVPSERLYPTLP